MRCRLCHLAVPQNVVGQNERAACDISSVEQHVVIGRVLALVAVDEDQIVDSAQPRHYIQCRAYMLYDLASVRRAVEERGGHLLQLVVDLARVDHTALVEACGHRQCRVARESADFENAPRAKHAHDHFQQPALHVPRDHARIEHAKIGLAFQLVEQCLLGCRVVEYVTFDSIHRIYL